MKLGLNWVYFAGTLNRVFIIMTVNLPVEMAVLKLAQINMIDK
jgi:hypothetical protein